MTSVLSSRHISVYPEPSVDASYLLASYLLWYKSFYSTPELVVERLVDDPVEVMRKHTGIFTLGPHRGVGNELDGLSCRDDG
jgi:hypothetical protein